MFLINLFCLALVLIVLPPLNLPYPIMTSYRLFRILVLFILGWEFLKNKNLVRVNHLNRLVTLFFVTQGLSVIGAVNQIAFFSQFEKLFFCLGIFLGRSGGFEKSGPGPNGSQLLGFCRFFEPGGGVFDKSLSGPA